MNPTPTPPPMMPGFYLATHPERRPSVVEFCTVTTLPHWRNQLDDRIRFDPREEGYELTPITKGWGAIAPPDLSRELTAENVQALEDLQKRFDHHRDWNQQRYNALRKWVDDEVKPLSAEVHHRYYSIIANGSPSPHESADWSGTLHAITLQRDAAKAEANRLRCDLADVVNAGAAPSTIPAGDPVISAEMDKLAAEYWGKQPKRTIKDSNFITDQMLSRQKTTSRQSS